MIAFSCPQCGKPIRAAERHAGKKASCPKCKNKVQIPEPNPLAPTKEFMPTEQVAAGATPSDAEDARQFTVQPVQLEEALPDLPGYTIRGELGRGGMGVVYLAHQIALDRSVAIKTVNVSKAANEQLIARFEKEAISLAQLRHPNIVVAYDFGRQGSTLYLVMELLEGMDLEQYITEHGPLDEFPTLCVLRQAASGLAHAAQANLIHRDIKPGNLFLIEPPEGSSLPENVYHVKVTDFGLVQLQGDIDQAKRLTQTGSVVGTPLFMAPEQIRGTPLDLRCDIYALGMTAVNMLTGETPYPDKTVWEIVTDKAQNLAYPIPEDCSPPTQALIRAMLAPVPDERIDNYRDLIRQIDAILQGNGAFPSHHAEGVRGGNDSFDQRSSRNGPKRTKLRNREFLLGLFAAVFLVAATAIAGFYYFTRPPREIPMEPVGQPNVLFQGKSISDWTLREGQWKSTKGFEEGIVLAGAGIIQREVNDYRNYRLTFGLDLRDAKRVEVHFGILAGDGEEQAPRHVLRIENEGTAEVGQQSGDHGTFSARAPLRTLEPLSGIARPFREVRIERRGPYWYVLVQGSRIAKLRRHSAERPEFRLASVGGVAHFEEFQIVELRPIAKK